MARSSFVVAAAILTLSAQGSRIKASSGLASNVPVHVQFPNLHQQVLDGPMPEFERPVLLSGAARGVDTLFGELAQKHHHDFVHFICLDSDISGSALDSQADNLYMVSDSFLNGSKITTAYRKVGRTRVLGSQLEAYEAAEREGNKGWFDDWWTSRRNYLQVRRADVVYALAYRDAKRPCEETPRLDMGGGTGWASQFYVDRFGDGKEDPANCHLYFWDDGRREASACENRAKTWHRWSKWNIATQDWEPLPDGQRPPRPTGIYAGIGGTRMSPTGEEAIRALYED